MGNILLVGHGRSGKDIGGEYLEKVTGLKFAGTTSKYLCKYVARHLGIPEEEAYARRHESDEMRIVWYNVGNNLRANDPGLLIREAFAVGPISGGVRDMEEIVYARQTGEVDLVVWIDNCRVDFDPTVKFDHRNCDMIVQNHRSLEEYYFRLHRLAKFAGLLKEQNDSHVLTQQ